jgi:pSer/pThr/pTyr-binding forkhead associated (FHA) protein
MAKLLVKTDGFQNRVIELKLGVNHLGRSPDSDFQLEHSTISAMHCEIELREGELRVRDCDSTNGTFIDGQPIHQATLRAGQTLCIGDVELYVESTDVRIAIPEFEIPYDAPAPPVVLSDGSLVCPRHPQARVTHQCTHCHEVMCDECVHRLRRRGGKVWELCPRCSRHCEPIGAAKKKKKNKFVRFLTSTVKLPFLHTTSQEKEE